MHRGYFSVQCVIHCTCTICSPSCCLFVQVLLFDFYGEVYVWIGLRKPAVVKGRERAVLHQCSHKVAPPTNYLYHHPTGLLEDFVNDQAH